MNKRTTFMAGVIAGVVLVVGLPNSLWAKSRPVDRHDCHRVKTGYLCEKGPLAGRSFASRQAMIRALRMDSAPGALQPVRDQPLVKKKPSKAKSAR
ncbi:MAG: hypothetical protein NW703_02700 [Nitrospiraceae bacterium]